MRKLAIACTSLILGCSTESTHYQALHWFDLIPEDQVTYQMQLDEFEHVAAAGPQAGLSQVTMRSDIEGKSVKLAGFVVPLELDVNNVYQFLLVPYHGACIHVPPPPANQILHVTTDTGLPIELTHDPIWVEGSIMTTAMEFDVAQVGYSLAMDHAYFYDAAEADTLDHISTASPYPGVFSSVFN
ncbi:DUF3299 domain-containing protein [Vibrio agarivorans]|uniref:DUF3299 domain-containing protein n=1 Tax=Vibrio agarivorans TaxID=153622 RepID=A0ABT7Y623_9VIBR|nr:DUF3299 domain-containing protein [Vibrio agarivorans]MDN2483503.1 DUF3299 domain-containing protein [Vibrio agarivorans]